MSRYAKIELSGEPEILVVAETRNMASNFDPAEVAHKGDFRIVIQQTDPVFDAATHILVTPPSVVASWDFVINPADVEATRKVRALTQPEIDANTANATAQAERDQAIALVPDLMAGTVSDSLQQKILARIIQDMNW